MLYAVTKLYADLVADDGTVAVCYLGWLDLFGARRRYAALEVYGPDGKREVWHSRVPGDYQAPRRPTEGVDVVLETSNGRARFRHSPIAGAYAPDVPPSEAVSWTVVTAAAEAELSWLDRGGSPIFSGSGYADWVVLRRPTRLLGLRSLEWGRARVVGETLVFTALSFADGERWSCALRCSERDGVLEVPLLSVDSGPAGTSVQLGEGRLDLQPVRVLHDGPALDPQRFPRWLERALVRAANGPTEETRWISTARYGNRQGVALHEAVEFSSAQL